MNREDWEKSFTAFIMGKLSKEGPLKKGFENLSSLTSRR